MQKSVNLGLQQIFFIPTHYSVKQLWIKACKECLVRQKIGNYCKKYMLLQELWCLAQDFYIIRRRKIGTFPVWSNYKCNFEMSPAKKDDYCIKKSRFFKFYCFKEIWVMMFCPRWKQKYKNRKNCKKILIKIQDFFSTSVILIVWGNYECNFMMST